MDFYKKIVKTKDVNSVLSEKEYKCVSLQAISTEAIKENNKKTLKDLVEEINGHLTDLQAIYNDIKEPRNKEKCDKLIKQYQECLVKIVNNKFSDVVITITRQLNNWEALTNEAIRENNLEELNELVDRMERNFEVMKEIPEVKRARSMENGDEKILEIINKYKAQLNKAMGHIIAQKRIISGPVLLQEKLVEEKTLELTEPLPVAKPNKIVLNEVEERLKQMRQKRLNRLSTFVDQQTKLSEDRSRENALKTSQKKCESLSELVEKVENEPAIKSNAAPYKANKVQEKVVRASEQTVFAKPEEKEKGKIIEAITLQGGLRSNSFIKAETIISPKTSSNIDHAHQSSSDYNNFRKSSVTRSFAERQIENARNQMEKPKVKQQSKTPPRSPPTQIRKIFNSLNSCVLGANVHQKSIEDLPSEYNSHFEQELKNVKLKSTKWNDGVEQEQSTGRYPGFKEKEHFGERELPKAQEPIPVLPPRVPLEKSTATSIIGQKDSNIHKIPIEKSASQSQIASSSEKNLSWRKSLDCDAIIRPQKPLENVTITVKRDSSSLPASEKYPFTTFKSNLNENNAFETPLYAIVNTKEDIESAIEESKRKIRKLSNDSNRFIVLEPMIAKLEFAIRTFKGLKRDDDYYWLDKLLSKYYVKVDEVTASTAFDEIEKQNLLERLKKASKDLEKRANKNEVILKIVLEEQVIMIGMKYGLCR
ncbi:unnamed protein product [Ceutorhynchus assimilis]|uniref:Uncharacterized protein n=1 Tax=Ceutorhynchus assimilis TaxID=467358 RepID=A0A9N9N0M2_9CUCU|nr:unnamed protein product [Ceutorhynchus assimilis]